MLCEPELSEKLRSIPARRLVVIIDACHSGGVSSFKKHKPLGSLILGYTEKSLGRLAQGAGRVLIASSRASETSLVLDGERNSVFTRHLLEALRGQGRTSGDGLIRVFEIFNHVSETVKRTVPGRQHPIFKASDLEDNFPVAPRPRGNQDPRIRNRPWNDKGNMGAVGRNNARPLSAGANGSGNLVPCRGRFVSNTPNRNRQRKLAPCVAGPSSRRRRGGNKKGEFDRGGSQGFSASSGIGYFFLAGVIARFVRRITLKGSAQNRASGVSI